MDKNKQKFFNKYSGLSDEDFKLELLYSQKIIHGKLHRVRSNLTRIIWVVAIFIIIYTIGVVMSKYG